MKILIIFFLSGPGGACGPRGAFKFRVFGFMCLVVECDGDSDAKMISSSGGYD